MRIVKEKRTHDVLPLGAHDPKLDSKIKGFVTEKLKRFHDNKGIAIAMYQCALKMQAMWRLLLERRKHHENTIETKQDQVQKWNHMGLLLLTAKN